jgi:hypothetical protein
MFDTTCPLLNRPRIGHDRKLLFRRGAKELTRPPPVVRCFPQMAQFRETLRHIFRRILMINEVPFYDSIQQPDGSWKSEVVISRPIATFQWPPDCLWPFIDHAAERKT